MENKAKHCKYQKALLFLNGQHPSQKTMLQAASVAAGQGVLTVCADGAFQYVKDYLSPHVIIGDFDSLFPICDEKDSQNNSALHDISINELQLHSALKLRQDTKIIRLPVEKDFTDGHISLEYILDMGIREIIIYGGTGNRLDHTVSNFALLALAAKRGAIAVIDSEDYLVTIATSFNESKPPVEPMEKTKHFGSQDALKLDSYNKNMTKDNTPSKMRIEVENTFIEQIDGEFLANVRVGSIISLVPFSDIVHILYTRGLKYPICDRSLGKLHILGISNEAIDSQIVYKLTSGDALVFLQK